MTRATRFERLRRHVDAGSLPGLIALAATGDEATVEVIGTKSFGDPEPMGRDAIFRIASLSKPIAAAVAMTMVDDGTFALDDPVERWLPELADRQVLRSIDSDLDDTVPAERSITVEDLLTFRLGFGAIMAPSGTYPIQNAEAALDLKTLGPPWPPSVHTNDEWIARFASLPLLHQPGAGWMYNTGAQVLGVLLERAGGMSTDDVFRTRLFEPLGMTDTAFSVPPAKLHRLTTAYCPNPVTDAPDVLDPADDTSWWSRPPAMSNAAGWLVSTIDDLWAFVRMLVLRGRHDGRTVLTERSIETMTTDHLTADERAASTLFLGAHGGWGLGLAVQAMDDPVPNSPAGFGWDGGTGTAWRTDPATGRTGILLTQSAMTSPQQPVLYDDFWDCVTNG